MSKLSLVYDFVNGTDADAVPVQQNFQNVETTVNNEMIERDGSVEMRADLILAGMPGSDMAAAPRAYVQAYGEALVPIGAIIMWGGTTAPVGGVWALANGALLSTTSYPELFAVYGYRFGGSGGNFGLPPLMSGNGVFPLGGAGTRPVGATGGSADAVVVSHQHDMSHGHSASSGVESATHIHGWSGTTDTQGNHNHTPAGGGNFVQQIGSTAGIGAGTGYALAANTADAGAHAHNISGATGGQNANHTHSISVVGFSGNTGATGVSGTGANMPPFLALAFLVRVA